MLPKAFLVTDMQRELGATVSNLADIRRRLTLTQRQIESQRRMIDALRKRVDRSKARAKGASPPPRRSTPSPQPEGLSVARAISIHPEDPGEPAPSVPPSQCNPCSPWLT